MKKIIFIILVTMFGLGIVWGDGTVRVYTGYGQWWYRHCGQNCDGVPFVQAVNVVQYWDDNPPDNPWDRDINPVDAGPPRPWEKLYEQNPRPEGFWIGIRNDGNNSTVPDTYWFYSPTFYLYSNISRATIWLSADDVIDKAWLRDLNTGAVYDMPCIPVNGFGRFRRFDLTDFFRSIGSTPQGCRMEFRVRNTGCCYMGIVAYMSYDYGSSRNYTYSLSGSGYRYVSLPFRPVNVSGGLQALFPGINGAAYFNWATNSWVGLPINSPLTGSLGDIVRTYTIRLHYPSGGSHSTTISGYPIFEQRYLDITTNWNLYFGTINCDCPSGQIGSVLFIGSNPDDLWWDKITGTVNWSYDNADVVGGNGTFSTPIYELFPKYAYYVVPHPTVPNCAGDCLPYHLDIINYRCYTPGSLAGEEKTSEEYSETEFEGVILNPDGPPIDFPITERELALSQWIEDSIKPYIHIPDSAEVCAQFPDLCEREIGLHKSGETEERGKRNILQVSASPSPFNAELTIDVSVPEDAYLTIGIYDISGILVKTLFVGEVQAGEHSFIWDGTGDIGDILPSGNYLVRVSNGSEVVITRVVMVK